MYMNNMLQGIIEIMFGKIAVSSEINNSNLNTIIGVLKQLSILADIFILGILTVGNKFRSSIMTKSHHRIY